ncbi:nucleotidyltransferase family protein [Microbacterium aurantiacum]|uniref:Nucleotidyltransferase family protein n=1 Tax=Microbacterium aurantiacum TaxID=162393 RepID=A0ABT8FND3_9MICO|nr:nucleotidyltransferase family protein [Microbacterium aurantiacum]MDN4462827.1 nucleotidyltransferase family protein [Microbacterium aurantiacum]
MDQVGVVLAAGAGTRFGGPKALARTPDGEPWIARAVTTLTESGCREVVVVLGARADEARLLVPDTATVVVAADWAEGLSASVRAALRVAEGTSADRAVVVPVDTPDLPVAAVRRVLAASVITGAQTLARAVYDGRPGHPVVLGRTHWHELAAVVQGDQGAGPYLRAHDATEIECRDLWDGADIDHRP